MSRIEQLISDIESYIDTCKYYPLSNVKIIVNKEQLEDMLTELRLKTPDEVKKYQKILSNKDAILADAMRKWDFRWVPEPPLPRRPATSRCWMTPSTV